MSAPQGPRRAPAPVPPRPGARRAATELWRRCWNGQEPAEALPPRDREDLIYHLHRAGWSDLDIARHARLSLYTTGRILNRLGLTPRPDRR